jgi:hypothetical protein
MERHDRSVFTPTQNAVQPGRQKDQMAMLVRIYLRRSWLTADKKGMGREPDTGDRRCDVEDLFRSPSFFSTKVLRLVSGFRILVPPVELTFKSEENTCKERRCILLPLRTLRSTSHSKVHAGLAILVIVGRLARNDWPGQ